jgi:MATE family multidrug resistance protein
LSLAKRRYTRRSDDARVTLSSSLRNSATPRSFATRSRSDLRHSATIAANDSLTSDVEPSYDPSLMIARESSDAPRSRWPDPPLSTEIRALLRLAWPIAISEFAFMLMGLVDTAILGHVSATELAASALGRTVAFTAMTPGFGITMGLEPLASQAVGAGENDRAWAAFMAAMKATSLAWVPLMIACMIVLYCLEAIGIDPAIATRARVFALAQAPGFLFALVYLAAKTFLQSHSKTRAVIIAAPLANIVNFFLCNVLARGDNALIAVGLRPMGLPTLGVFGAGIAFSISQFFMMAIVVRAAWALRPKVRVVSVSAAAILKFGRPVALQLLAEAGVFCLATIVVGRFGAARVSAHQIALGIASFTFMGAIGVSGATAVRVGYAVGQSRSPRRAGLVGIVTGGAYMIVCASLIALLRSPLASIFAPDENVRDVAIGLLEIVAVFQLFDGVQAVAAGALRGAGDVKIPFYVVVIAYWFIGVPFALVLGFGMHQGVRGIWWGLAAGLVSAATFLVTRFVWLTRTVIARV